MSTHPRLRALFALFAALVLGARLRRLRRRRRHDERRRRRRHRGERRPDRVQPGQRRRSALTVGSKNFTEQIILGEIYAQALEAAGYDVKTDLNLGSEQVALKALESGEISGYPEYTSTALTSFFGIAPEDVPGDAQEALDEVAGRVREEGPGRLPADAVLVRERGRDAGVDGRGARDHARSPTSRTTRT